MEATLNTYKGITSVHSSQYLMSKGLDPETADGYWTVPITHESVPFWTVWTLLKMMPSEIDLEAGWVFKLRMFKHKPYWHQTGNYDEYYTFAYTDDEGRDYAVTDDPSMLQAAIQMIVVLLNNHVITNINDL